ncbi:hypothetical protein RUND412_001707 [Rhizina undulata]
MGIVSSMEIHDRCPGPGPQPLEYYMSFSEPTVYGAPPGAICATCCVYPVDQSPPHCCPQKMPSRCSKECKPKKCTCNRSSSGSGSRSSSKKHHRCKCSGGAAVTPHVVCGSAHVYGVAPSPAPLPPVQQGYYPQVVAQVPQFQQAAQVQMPVLDLRLPTGQQARMVDRNTGAFIPADHNGRLYVPALGAYIEPGGAVPAARQFSASKAKEYVARCCTCRFVLRKLFTLLMSTSECVGLLGSGQWVRDQRWFVERLGILLETTFLLVMYITEFFIARVHDQRQNLTISLVTYSYQSKHPTGAAKNIEFHPGAFLFADRDRGFQINQQPGPQIRPYRRSRPTPPKSSKVVPRAKVVPRVKVVPRAKVVPTTL